MIKHILEKSQAGDEVEVLGWIRTSRFSKNVSFLHLYDGSSTKTIQVVLPKGFEKELLDQLTTGASVKVSGQIVKSPGKEQAIEVLATKVELIGESNPTTFPIQKKDTSPEFLRTVGHLRPRVDHLQSVFRIRNTLSWEIHKFFQERDFIWAHTPIISAADCEGAGEVFEIKGSEEFFGKKSFLTVSGQLQGESFAQAFSKIYTFGPTFRAEDSNTARHASEFWMIEPEIAFSDLDDVMSLAESFIREVVIQTVDKRGDDFEALKREGHSIVDIVDSLKKQFNRISYTDAQEVLLDSEKKGKKFEYPIGWGSSMQSEHERFLAEEYFKSPVFITDYPWEQKAFYMRRNADGKTVAATDLLVPHIGEIIGGSQREERYDVLEQQMRLKGIDPAALQWYLDLRKWGSTPHGGFGLGLERLIMWITGTRNIRDVIPFPRVPGSVEF